MFIYGGTQGRPQGAGKVGAVAPPLDFSGLIIIYYY